MPWRGGLRASWSTKGQPRELEQQAVPVRTYGWPRLISKLATLLISPLGTALVLGAVAVMLSLVRKPRAALVCGVAAILWVTVWSMPVVSHAVRASLEQQFPPIAADTLPAAPAMVVLGGGITPASVDHALPGLSAAADRVWHAARIFRAGKAPWVVLSGGADAAAHITSEAQAMAQLLAELGVPPAAMWLEERSRNTEENARFTAELLQARGIQQVLLVTSALHMQRALAHFRAQGLDVVPAATDHESRDTTHWPWWRRWLPDADSLNGSAQALKEWAGPRPAAARLAAPVGSKLR